MRLPAMPLPWLSTLAIYGSGPGAVQQVPLLRLILAADDDAFTDGNPGITKATEAAKAVGGIPHKTSLFRRA